MRYTKSLEGITSEMLDGGFFVGWPNPPSPVAHYEILENAYRIVLAIDDSTNKVIGFINSISDGVLTTYIPLLEVLPEYQGKGIGKRLVNTLVEDLNEMYMIDILCAPDVQEFYTKLGFETAQGVAMRNYHNQSGINLS
nr:GNAT family N-acetyltransferase [Thermoflavimicrobium daqui]